MKISPLAQSDFSEWLKLASELWPDEPLTALAQDLEEIFLTAKQDCFLVRDEREQAIAFITLSLRSDYVPGAKSQPVAYIEGIYVLPQFRHQGMGRKLIEFAENWAREKGCQQLASDVLLDNIVSQQFHQSVGFQEVERVIFYIKEV